MLSFVYNNEDYKKVNNEIRMIIDVFDDHYRKLNLLYENPNIENFENIDSISVGEDYNFSHLDNNKLAPIFKSLIELKINKIESCNNISGVINEFYNKNTNINSEVREGSNNEKSITEKAIELVDILIEKQIFYSIKLKTMKEKLQKINLNKDDENSDITGNIKTTENKNNQGILPHI